MKTFIAIALLSAAVAAPAFADDAAKAPAKKAVPAAPAHKGKAKAADDCDSAHGMGGYHEGYGGGMGYGAGMEHGMGGHGGLEALGLSKEQQDKITKLHDELKHNNWTTQGQINDETAKLRDLYEADKRDPDAIDKEYQKVFDLKRQMIRDYLTTQNRIDEVLTPEQQAKLKESRRGGMGDGYGHM